MSLKYRGISYETSETEVSVSEEVIGRYRGAVVTRHLAKNVTPKHPQGLKYRGAPVR
jgi:hypothetical protein